MELGNSIILNGHGIPDGNEYGNSMLDVAATRCALTWRRSTPIPINLYISASVESEELLEKGRTAYRDSLWVEAFQSFTTAEKALRLSSPS